MRQEPKNRKTFVVSVIMGHLFGSPWPFGRLHICDETITVRSMFREKTCPRSEITDISLERLGPQNQLLFVDAADKMSGVAVVLATRVKGVVGELRRRGYPVVDRRARILSFPEGVVPWRGEDSAEGREPPRR
jgi:hypothetical protein